MPAHNSTFPWLSYYGHYKFFESRMAEHSKVLKTVHLDTGLYKIHLVDGRQLKIFICECYVFSDADYFEVLEKYGPVSAIVISSNWCGYDLATKVARMAEEVGIFDIKGFMAAINRRNYWEYMTDWERDRLRQSPP